MRYTDTSRDVPRAPASRLVPFCALPLALAAATSCAAPADEPARVGEAASAIGIVQTENPDPTASDLFAYSVSLADGNFGAVGVPYRSGTGQVYVYKDLLMVGPVTFQTKLSPPGSPTGDRFGQAVAISDGASYGAIAVGAPGHTAGSAANRGKVYVYVYNANAQTWDYHSSVEPPNGAAGDQFGFSVDISWGSTPYLLVGAPYHAWSSNTAQGAAYAYRWNGTTWQLENALKAPDGAAYDHFGYSVKIGSAPPDTAAYGYVGAPDDDGTYANQGSVYVFRQPGFWTYQAKLVASDPVTGARFGASVDQEQWPERVVAGAPGATAGSVSGAGAVYELTGSQSAWTQVAKHTSPTPAMGEQFGASVATNEDALAVGAPGITGHVYHYDFDWPNAYVYQGSVANPTGTPDLFGRSVGAGAHGAYCFIGAPYADLGGVTNSGALYIAEFGL